MRAFTVQFDYDYLHVGLGDKFYSGAKIHGSNIAKDENQIMPTPYADAIIWKPVKPDDGGGGHVVPDPKKPPAELPWWTLSSTTYTFLLILSAILVIIIIIYQYIKRQRKTVRMPSYSSTGFAP